MATYVISDIHGCYDEFMTMLRHVTQHPDRFVLKQHNNRLAMTVRNIKDVEDAYKTLQEL